MAEQESQSDLTKLEKAVDISSKIFKFLRENKWIFRGLVAFVPIGGVGIVYQTEQVAAKEQQVESAVYSLRVHQEIMSGLKENREAIKKHAPEVHDLIEDLDRRLKRVERYHQ